MNNEQFNQLLTAIRSVSAMIFFSTLLILFAFSFQTCALK